MEFSIGDVEKLTGISKDRLRYYEEKGLIIPGRNEDNSYRVYDIEEILKLLGIQLYRAMDMGVKDIQAVQESESLEDMQSVFTKQQSRVSAQIARLQKQNEYIKRCIDDCEKIRKHLNRISLQNVTWFTLTNRIEGFPNMDEQTRCIDSVGKHKVIIRSFVRRLELTEDGVGENAVFFGEDDESQSVECVYTIAAEDTEHDPMMETYSKCMKWTEENRIRIGRYCYVRPLLISHFGNRTGSYLEIFVPIEK